MVFCKSSLKKTIHDMRKLTFGYGSKLGTPIIGLLTVNAKLDIHICGPTSVFHFDPHPFGKKISSIGGNGRLPLSAWRLILGKSLKLLIFKLHKCLSITQIEWGYQRGYTYGMIWCPIFCQVDVYLYRR